MPSASVSVNGSVRSARLHVPVDRLPFENTERRSGADGLGLGAVGVRRRSAGSRTASTTHVVRAAPGRRSTWCGSPFCVRRHRCRWRRRSPSAPLTPIRSPMSTADAGAPAGRLAPGARYWKIGVARRRRRAMPRRTDVAGVPVEVVRRASRPSTRNVRRRPVGQRTTGPTTSDCVGVDAGVAAAPGEQRLVQRAEQVDVLGAAGADRADRVGVLRVEHRGEAGDAALDDLLEHDVGLVEARLRCGGSHASLSILTTSAGRSARSSPDRRPARRSAASRHGRRRPSWSAPPSWSARPSSASPPWSVAAAVVARRRWSASEVAGRRGRRRRVVAAGARTATVAAPISRPAAGEARRGATNGGDRMGVIVTALSAGRSAPRAAGGCRTACGPTRAVPRRRRPTSAARSTGVPWRSTPSASPWCRPAASPAPRSSPAGTG